MLSYEGRADMERRPLTRDERKILRILDLQQLTIEQRTKLKNIAKKTVQYFEERRPPSNIAGHLLTIECIEYIEGLVNDKT